MRIDRYTTSLIFLLLTSCAHFKSAEERVMDVAEENLQSVVNVASTTVIRESPFAEHPFFRFFFGEGDGEGGGRAERRQRSLGSGVIVSTDGVVLTNNHVVAHADEIVVTLYDGREMDAELVGTDPKSDVAVLKLKGYLKNIRAVTFGDVKALRLGETVVAIGNPFGVGQTVTTGIVSAKGRRDMGIVDYEDFIQTDAAINPGNSGGALLNLDGELVGINTAILSQSGGYQGIGFAIPINMVKPIMESLLKTGTVERGWIGAQTQNLDRELAKGLNAPVNRGAVVTDVLEGGPAAQAGIRAGDIIVRARGEEIVSASQFRTLLASMREGELLSLRVIREGETIEFRVTVGNLPKRWPPHGARGFEQQGL